MSGRYAKRIDATHKEVREAFRRVGCSVHDAATAGGGFPDLVVAAPLVLPGLTVPFTFLCEVKTPRRASRLNPRQRKFARGWSGAFIVIESEAEAEEVVACLRAGSLAVFEEPRFAERLPKR